MVRAKVTCDSIDGNQVFFRTVYEPDAERDSENARFTKATPWGEIRMGIDNPAALEQFETGKSYYVDFSPVVAAAAAEAEQKPADGADEGGEKTE